MRSGSDDHAGPSPVAATRGAVFRAMLCGLGLLGPCGPAAADVAGTRRVIELFTSQGCPKCPPADRLIADLAGAPDTIALSFPVNYWDYIGWKDTLASPVFTARQRAYASARGDRRIFTPQAIIDGFDVEPGADREAILRDIGDLTDNRVAVSLTESGGKLDIHIGAGDAGGSAGIVVLRVARETTVAIARGENSGQQVTYRNVVRAMSRIGEWTGRPLDLQMVELKGDDEGYVVLLQAGPADKPGPILAAAKTADL